MTEYSLSDMAYKNLDKFQQLYDMFPNGPPTPEIARLGAEIPINEATDIAGVETINEPKLFRTTMPSGTVVEARYLSKKRWNLMIQSPQTFNGKQITVQRPINTFEGHHHPTGADYDAKMSALIDVSNLGKDMSSIRLIMYEKIQAHMETPIADLPPDSQAVMVIVHNTIQGNYIDADTLLEKWIDRINKNHKQTGSWKGNSMDGGLPYDLKLKTSDADILEAPDDLILPFTIIGLMDYCHDIHAHIFKEDSALAKNNGDKVWWQITGGTQSINKLTATLGKNKHFIVLNDDNSVYMNIQQSENKFVEGVVSKFNCKARHCDEPDWWETPCGKKTAQLEQHQEECNSCKREIDQLARKQMAPADNGTPTNEKAFKPAVGNGRKRTKGVAAAIPVSTTTLKRQEEQEWQSRNGEVILIEGPTQGIDPMDFKALAADNRRVANALLAKAAWFEQTADGYEALLRPSAAIQEAEEALRLAKETEDTERAKQVAALQRHLSDGPPQE